MVNFRQKFLTAVVVCGLSASCFAQKGSDNSNKRPPKDPPQVVAKDKPQKPPPSKKDKP
jgi:hypothetical protein